MDLIITILPVVTKDLLISPRFTPYNFLSRCKFSTLTTCQPMVEFYLLTFPRFPLRKKEHKFYFGKNRTHDLRTSRCAAYLLDHSGDELERHCDRATPVSPLSLPPRTIMTHQPGRQFRGVGTLAQETRTYGRSVPLAIAPPTDMLPRAWVHLDSVQAWSAYLLFMNPLLMTAVVMRTSK